MTPWLVAVVLSAASASDAEVRLPAPPDWLRWKRQLAPDDLARKNEGGYVTGLPLWNYDPNTGYGFGARAYYYDNGARDDALFAYTPYRYRLFLQGFASTGGLQYHWLDLDAPYIGATPYRVRGQLIYARAKLKTYFGVGARTMDELTFPGSSRTYGSYADYQRDLDRVTAVGTTYSLYNLVDVEQPLLITSIERELFGGRLRPFFGLGFSYTTLRDYTGQEVEAIEAPSAPTRLRDDCASGVVVGCKGGWDNTVRFAIAFDTRDFEPDPNAGVFADAALQLGTAALGSEYDYSRFLVAVRHYDSPMPTVADLVVAWRAMFMVQTRGAPFFSMNNLPFTEDTRYGLGGLRTLRGFKQDRFIGHVMTLANLELRWTFGRFEALGQEFAVMTTPFIDYGAVFDEVGDVELRDWRRAQGAGLRIAWNQATILMADYGFSDEDQGLYINFAHIF
jgi:hypothetical protein